jgi:hypothetical protein
MRRRGFVNVMQQSFAFRRKSDALSPPYTRYAKQSRYYNYYYTIILLDHAFAYSSIFLKKKNKAFAPS